MLAVTFSCSPSTGVFVSTMLRANVAGDSTVTFVLSASSAEETVTVYVPASPAPVSAESVTFVELLPASVTDVESDATPSRASVIVCVSLTSPTFSIRAVTFSCSPSAGVSVSTMSTPNSAGESTVTFAVAVSSAEETVAVYVPASPAPVPSERVTSVELPAASVTVVESVPSAPASSVIVCVCWVVPVFSTVAFTCRVSPSMLGVLVESMVTAKPLTPTVIVRRVST